MVAIIHLRFGYLIRWWVWLERVGSTSLYFGLVALGFTVFSGWHGVVVLMSLICGLSVYWFRGWFWVCFAFKFRQVGCLLGIPDLAGILGFGFAGLI